jgi:hypothetical protein
MTMVTDALRRMVFLTLDPETQGLAQPDLTTGHQHCRAPGEQWTALVKD